MTDEFSAAQILLDAAPSLVLPAGSSPTLFAVAFATRGGVRAAERSAFAEAVTLVYDDPGSRPALVEEAFPVFPRGADGPEHWDGLRPAIVEELDRSRARQPAAAFVLSLAERFPFAYAAVNDDATGGGYIDNFAMTAIARALEGTGDLALARQVLGWLDQEFAGAPDPARQVISEFVDTLGRTGPVFALLPPQLARLGGSAPER